MNRSSPARSSAAVEPQRHDVDSKPRSRSQSGRVIALQDKLLLSVGSIMLASTIGGVFLIVTKTTQHLEQLAAGGAIDAVQIRREVPELYREVGGYALALIAIALPCLYLLVQRVFTPVRRLAIAAKNVTAGKFQTVDIRRGDALGVLAGSFNEMVIRLEEQQRLTSDAHDKLRLSNATLEQKVAERTHEIEAATHRLSSEIAEKEDFLRAVSHDLNAPLRNIDGMVTMMLRKHDADLPEEVLSRLERVKKNVKVETDLINDLLELSRIKTRREQQEPVDLTAMVEDLRGMFENDLRDKKIDLVIETKLPTLEAERGRVRQVLQNLIDNAIKYMGDAKERRIGVGCLLRRDEAEFYVRDTGAGIAAEDIEKVFYVFRRGSNHSNVAGKGIGLASVKSIVETYQGSIWVESQLGRGSAFKFTFNGQYVRGSKGMFKGADAPAVATEPGDVCEDRFEEASAMPSSAADATTEFVRTLEPAETSQSSQIELAESPTETEVEAAADSTMDSIPQRVSPVSLDDLPPLPPIAVDDEIGEVSDEPVDPIDASTEPDADGFLPLKDEAA